MTENWTKLMSHNRTTDAGMSENDKQIYDKQANIHASICISKHVICKPRKPKSKRKSWKETEENKTLSIEGNRIRITADLPSKTIKARRQLDDIFVFKGKMRQKKITNLKFYI